MNYITDRRAAIAAYLRQMKFKRRIFGGADDENVLDHFERVTGMYRDELEELQNRSAHLLEENSLLQDNLWQLQQTALAADARARSLMAERDTLLYDRDSLLYERETLLAKTQETAGAMARSEAERAELDAWARRAAMEILENARLQAGESGARRAREPVYLPSARPPEPQFPGKRWIPESMLDELTLRAKNAMSAISTDLGQLQSLANNLESSLTQMWDEPWSGGAE